MEAEIVLLPELPEPNFNALLRELSKLSRAYLLEFRVEVGRRLSKAFYDHDARRYGARLERDSSFARFLRTHEEELRDLGLSEQILRQSLLAYRVVKDLPHAVLARLLYTHVVELTRVEDRHTRDLLARATVDNGWTGARLADAVLAVRAGRWPDADALTPGLQPAPPPAEVEEAPAPQAGRVVNRFERTARDLGGVIAEWERVPAEKLTELQRQRVSAVVAELEVRVAALRQRLG